MGAASALGQDASILSPLSQAHERTTLERADRTSAHFCFALGERSSEKANPAQLVVVEEEERTAAELLLDEFECCGAPLRFHSSSSGDGGSALGACEGARREGGT
jgi:hypothetical protein